LGEPFEFGLTEKAPTGPGRDTSQGAGREVPSGVSDWLELPMSGQFPISSYLADKLKSASGASGNVSTSQPLAHSRSTGVHGLDELPPTLNQDGQFILAPPLSTPPFGKTVTYEHGSSSSSVGHLLCRSLGHGFISQGRTK
jgi:hypothetical protein